MISAYVKMDYWQNDDIWAGKYRNLHNLPHWHTEHEIIYVAKGTADVVVNQNYYHAEQGDTFFCHGEDTHRISSSNNSIVITILFNAAQISDIIQKYELCDPKLEYVYPIEELYEKIHDELRSRGMFFKIKTEAYISELMVDVFRKEKIQPCNNKARNHNNHKDLQSILMDNIETITFKDAAKKIGVSEPYFSRYFKKMFNMTFSEYMRIMRVEYAIRLLYENEFNCTEIAGKCGFDSLRTFNRVFKQMTGVTPSSISKKVNANEYINPTWRNFDPTMPISELIDDVR